MEKSSTDKLKYIFDNAKVGIAICNAQSNRLEMVNPAFAAIHGYEPDELIGITPSEVFASECMMRLNSYESIPSCGVGDISFETLHLRKDGSTVPVSVHITVIKDDNGVVKQRISNIIDISDRKQAEANLSDTNERYTQIFDNSMDNIFLVEVTPENRFIHLEVNPAYLESCGIPKEMIMGRYVDEIDDLSLRNTLIKQYQACVKAGEKIEYTSELEFSTGRKIFHSTLSPIRNASGRIHRIVGVSRDITELKRTERRLQQTIEFAEGIITAIPDVLCEMDRKGEYLNIWTQRPEQLVIPKNQLLGNTIHDVLSPEAAKITMEAIEEATEFGLSFGKIVRMNLPDGEKWFELSVSRKVSVEFSALRFLVLSRDVTERIVSKQKIEFMAHHDALTGLPNRVLAEKRVRTALATAQDTNHKCALLFIDLDGFKTVNDSLGHSVGDAMLKCVALRLSQSLRPIDTLSRQGGDEFLLIIPQIKNKNEIIPIVEKLLKEFEDSFSIDTQMLSTSASIGIAIYPEDGESFETLLQNADTAMYKAKESGKNTYCFFTEQMGFTISGQLRIQNDLKNAIANNEFILHYQPQIDVERNFISGVEALIRWNHPELGLIPPMSFIPIAEASGLIVQIGEWVIQESCRQAAAWYKKGIPLTIAVNISGIQFQRGNLESVVRSALKISGLPPCFLELELTESIMMHHVENTLQTVQSLKALGIRLSIDDFGTGYSSLAYLKRFAVDKLKIDQSFIRDILQDQEDAIIVSTIIQMAKSLNLQTIAEGVENDQILERVLSYGCDEVQGYHFAKPMSADDLEHYYLNFSNKIN